MGTRQYLCVFHPHWHLRVTMAVIRSISLRYTTIKYTLLYVSHFNRYSALQYISQNSSVKFRICLSEVSQTYATRFTLLPATFPYCVQIYFLVEPSFATFPRFIKECTHNNITDRNKESSFCKTADISIFSRIYFSTVQIVSLTLFFVGFLS